MNRNEDTETKCQAYCPLCSGIPLLKANCSLLRTHNARYERAIVIHSIIRIDSMYGENKVLSIKSHFYFFLLVFVGGIGMGSRITLMKRAGTTSSYPFFN